MMSIIIGADIVPTKSNYSCFINADLESLIGNELKEVLDKANYRIFNLEVPLTDITSPIDKGGHNMLAPTKCVNALSAMKINLFTLSNNHILDQGVQGLNSTQRILTDNGINTVGVGKTLKEAVDPFIFEHNGKLIGVYACAEHEFSIATDNSAGANPFDPLESLDHVATLKQKCDYVIVLYHGGKECFRYPSPNLQRACRRLVDKGANIVICQHSHCIGCVEEYKSSRIVYGQGNFLFDKDNNEYWQTGMLVEINDDFSISFIPVVKHGSGVRLAENKKGQEILDAFFARSNEIQQEGFVESNYLQFAKNASGYYFLEFKGNELFMFAFRAINKISGQKLINHFSWRKDFHGRHFCAMRNYIECEAHREMIITAIRGK